MRYLITLALIVFSFNAFSQNPPYPCGTYQQGGKLCTDGNLYPSGACYGYYHPKRPQDYWEYVGTINYSPNWFVLRCGNDEQQENLPLDDYVPLLLLVAGCIGFTYVKRNERA